MFWTALSGCVKQCARGKALAEEEIGSHAMRGHRATLFVYLSVSNAIFTNENASICKVCSKDQPGTVLKFNWPLYSMANNLLCDPHKRIINLVFNVFLVEKLHKTCFHTSVALSLLLSSKFITKYSVSKTDAVISVPSPCLCAIAWTICNTKRMWSDSRVEWNHVETIYEIRRTLQQFNVQPWNVNVPHTNILKMYTLHYYCVHLQ